MADEQLRREITLLRREVSDMREMRKAELEHANQEKLDTRKMPPMAQMTRIQKRYFLEPWMSTLAIGFGFVSVAGFVLGMFTPLHVQFCMLGLLFAIIAGVCAVTKLNLMEWNGKTEGQIRDRAYRDY